MTLADVPAGETIFIDANIFVHAFAGDPIFGPACFDFIERIRRNEIEGIASAHVLSNVSHRLMTLEACKAFGWTYSGIANRLKIHPDQIAQLKDFRIALDEIAAAGVARSFSVLRRFRACVSG